MVALAGILIQTGMARRARAQISPGPLAHAHQSLDGPLNCLKCHVGKSEAMDGACLKCHTPIAALKSQNRGLHAATAGKACASCHPDHAGRSFDLIKWDSGTFDKFDHKGAGWPLEGKHIEAACRDCHKPAFQKAAFVADIPATHRAESWLGLERDCRGCHQDVHQGTLNLDCAACHTPASFKPATKFDHAKSDFALTGKHAKVACAKCHTTTRAVPLTGGEAKTMTVYKPEPHAACSACHKDPHAGRLGAACSDCHGTDDFRKVDRGDFDHGRTKFPLLGKHASVDCALCHDPVKAFGPRPAFNACTACHKDPHAGEALLAGKAVDCAGCHDMNGFRPTTFTVERHEAAAYPLVGLHRKVTCAACHPKAAAGRGPGTDVVKLRPKFAACRDCHAEAHGTQLIAQPDKGACESCHVPAGWKPSLFDATRHATLKLPLEGRHREIGCEACHGPKRRDLPPLPTIDLLGTAGVALALPGHACTDCHVDVHARKGPPTAPGRKPPVKTGGGAGAAVCLECHDAAGFRPSRVDVALHNAFAFPLEGAHQAVACEACHANLSAVKASTALLLMKPAPAPLPFGQESTICADCHKSPHGNQFEGRAGGAACGSCHAVDAFVPAARFDHDRDAAFPLKGAHQAVACEKCHPTHPGPDGKARIVYRPLDSHCEACHAAGSVKP